MTYLAMAATSTACSMMAASAALSGRMMTLLVVRVVDGEWVQQKCWARRGSLAEPSSSQAAAARFVGKWWQGWVALSYLHGWVAGGCLSLAWWSQSYGQRLI